MQKGSKGRELSSNLLLRASSSSEESRPDSEDPGQEEPEEEEEDPIESPNIPSRSRSRSRDDEERMALVQLRFKVTRTVAWSLGNEEESTREPSTQFTCDLEREGQWKKSGFEDLNPPGNPEAISLNEALFGEETTNISDEDEEVDEQPKTRRVTVEMQDDPLSFFGLAEPWEKVGTGLHLDLPDNIELCPVAAQFLAGCVEGGAKRIQELHIYTDGSFSPKYKRAAFAYGVFGYDPTKAPMHFFLGWGGDVLCIEPGHECFTGAMKQCSEEAEASALLWAHLWLMQHRRDITTTLHFDALTVGNALQGKWNTREGWLQGRRLRDIALLCKSLKRTSKIRYEHCKAHTNQPGNESMDGLAKALTKYEQPKCEWGRSSKRSDLFAPEDNRLQWAWWQVETIFNPSLPKRDADGMTISGPQQIYHMEGVTSIEAKEKLENKTFNFDIKVATYNVMTLHSLQDDGTILGETGRAAFLRSQLDHFGIHAIGIQESRAKKDILLCAEDYVRVVAAGSGGAGNHHGCELWLSRKQPIGRSGLRKIYFDHKKITVIIKNPRMLAANINIPGGIVQFVVAHAPHEKAEQEEKLKWWTMFGAHVGNWQGKCRMIIMGDFNARLQTPSTGRIGDRLCEGDQSNNGELLTEHVNRYDLIVPSTFSNYHTGEDWTWTHPKGKHARLDYVVLQEAEAWKIKESYVEHRILTSTAMRDHEAVVLHVEWQHLQGALKKKEPNYDWSKMATAEGQEVLRQAILEIPDPGWEVDVHQHWQCLEDGLHRCLEENFKQDKKDRRQDIFSEDTWTYRKNKLDIKEMLNGMDEAEEKIWKRIGFKSIQDKMNLRDLRRRYVVDVVIVELMKHKLVWAFRRLSRQLRVAIQKDKAKFIDKVTTEANCATGSNIYKELKKLRVGSSFRKKAIQTIPQLRDEEGKVAGDAAARDQIWSRYCARMEAGVKTTTQRMLLRARKAARARWESSAQQTKHLNSVPTLQELEGCFRRVKMHKAPGADRLRSDLCHLAATEMAAKFFPLMLKMFWRVEEPIQMKGGLLIAAHKGGKHDEVSCFRSLLLSSHAGKCLRRPIRQRLVQHYSASTEDLHMSVRTGSNVAHASISLRLALNGAWRLHMSAAVLFLDIRAAYYRVIRQLVSSVSPQEGIIRLLMYFDLEATNRDDLLRELQEDDAAEEIGVPRDLQELLSEAMSSTWFTTIFRSEVHESLAGSRPGDGLADVIFAMIFRRIMAKVKKDVMEHFEVDDAEISHDYKYFYDDPDGQQPPPMLNIIWADDLAVIVVHKDPSEVIRRIKTVTQRVFVRCSQHALIPNLSKGKTEILLRLRGKRSCQLRADYFNHELPSLEIEDVDEELCQVRLAAQYKHLGTLIHIKGGMMHEIKARTGAAMSIYRKHRRQIFQNGKIDLEKRKMLLKTLILSIVKFNTGTWPMLSDSEFGYFRSKIYKMYRGIARSVVGEEEQRSWNDDRMLAFMILPSAQCLLHEARLSYMVSVLSTGPEILKRLAAGEKHWLQAVRNAGDWLHRQLRGLGPDKYGNLWDPDLESCAKENPKQFKKWVRMAVQNECGQTRPQTEWREWHHQFLQQCIDFGLELDFPWPEGGDHKNKAEPCLPCGKLFKNKAAWAVHCFKKHGRVNDKRCLLLSSRCEACLKEYGSTVKLMRHLGHSLECAVKLRNEGLMTDIGPGINNKMTDKESDFPIPVLPTEGPERAWGVQYATSWSDGYNQLLAEHLIDLLLALPNNFDHNEAVEHIKTLLAQHVMSFDDIKRTFKRVWDDLPITWDEEVEGAPRRYKVEALCEEIWMRLRPEWYFSMEEHGVLPEDQEIRSAAWNFCSSTKTRPTWRKCPYIPRMRSRQLNYVHLFSGERRSGDLQDALGAVPIPSGCVRTVLSVDIIFDHRRANLCDPVVQQQWLSFVWSGKIHALYVGPPCESWSRARAKGGLPNHSKGDGGPRLVRTAERPQGLQELRYKEILQVITANRLLNFALQIFLAMVMTARLAVLEHPGEPDHPNEQWLASIWKLWVTRALVAHPFVQLAKVYQGYYNGKSPKPTFLMVAMGPDLCAQSILDARRTTSTLPPPLEMTKGIEFATAALKNYPKDFCVALSALADEWNSRYVVNDNFDMATGSDETFNKYVESLVCQFNEDAQRGADFHRHACL